MNIIIYVVTFFLFITSFNKAVAEPKAGDVYREYLRANNNSLWRVTNPKARNSRAQVYLPNPILDIEITDLTDAIKAEIVLDYWAGHLKTTGRQFRINNGTWKTIPYPPTITTSGWNHVFQYNPVIPISLSSLIVGINKLQGTCTYNNSSTDTGWGQWGWYSIIIRVYYKSTKDHATVAITSPASGSTIDDNPQITVDATTGAQPISRVAVVGYYNGVDENGDGIFNDWHIFYRYRNYFNYLDDHVGTSYLSPYSITWKNFFVPNQSGIKLHARVQDTTGMWYVSNEVTNLTLNRANGAKVILQKGPLKDFLVRGTKTLSINVSSVTNLAMSRIHIRHWNGGVGHSSSGDFENPLTVNSWAGQLGGSNHSFKQTLVDIPPSKIKAGSNTVTFSSNATSTYNEHGIELLWPGPSIITRYDANAPKIILTSNPKSGTTQGPIYLSLIADPPEADIFFSVTATFPSEFSPLYLKPLSVTIDKSFQAIAVLEGYKTSNVLNLSYIIGTGDVTPPTVNSVIALNDSTLLVTFSEWVSGNARVISYYTINNGAQILGVVHNDDKITVTVTTTKLANGTYTLSVENVRDLSRNTMSSPSVITFTVAMGITSRINPNSNWNAMLSFSSHPVTRHSILQFSDGRQPQAFYIYDIFGVHVGTFDLADYSQNGSQMPIGVILSNTGISSGTYTITADYSNHYDTIQFIFLNE